MIKSTMMKIGRTPISTNIFAYGLLSFCMSFYLNSCGLTQNTPELHSVDHRQAGEDALADENHHHDHGTPGPDVGAGDPNNNNPDPAIPPNPATTTNGKFTLAMADNAYRLAQNSKKALAITITPVDGFTGDIELTAPANLPAHAQMKFYDANMQPLAGNKVNISDANAKTIMAEVIHELDIVTNRMTADQPLALSEFAAQAKSGNLMSELKVQVQIRNYLQVKCETPATNGNRMVKPLEVAVKVGTGIAYINNYKNGLQLHGSPHQVAPGSQMGGAYDKYGGKTLTAAQLANGEVTPCSTVGNDTNYDHQDRNASGDIRVICQ